MKVQSEIANSTKRVLVVEDNSAFAIPVSHWLRHAGFSPKIAPRRDDAVNAMLFEAFPFILMDYQMPGMSALEFTELVRKLYPSTIIILISGNADVFEIASTLGITHVLQKPFNDEDLLSKLHRIDMANGNRTMFDT